MRMKTGMIPVNRSDAALTAEYAVITSPTISLDMHLSAGISSFQRAYRDWSAFRWLMYPRCGDKPKVEYTEGQPRRTKLLSLGRIVLDQHNISSGCIVDVVSIVISYDR